MRRVREAKGDVRGNRRHARLENDRSILISTSPRRVLPLIRFSSASTSSSLTSASFIRMRRRFPRRCAHGNRGVEQDSSGTRFYSFSLSLSLSHSLLSLFYIGSYMPRNIYRFPIILHVLLSPPSKPAARARAGPNTRSNTPLKIHLVVRSASAASPKLRDHFSSSSFFSRRRCGGGGPPGVCSINIFIPF